MAGIDFIGIIAGICTSTAVIAQIYKSLKTKTVKDVSPIMFTVLVIGIGLWVVYGIIIKDFPIIVTNSLALLLHLFMCVLIIKFRKK